jgi:predicted nucleic acid-binding protein
MSRLFIDSSVLFSAAYSSRGHARDLLMMAARAEVTLVISTLVVNETRRNLLENAPDVLDLFDLLIKTLPFEFVQPTRDDVLQAAKYAVLKDAPILAAAKKPRLTY